MTSFEQATPEEIRIELGARLRTLRLASNLKQEELAEKAGIAAGTIRNLETKGQATLDSLVRVTCALGATQHLKDLFVLQAASIADLKQQAVSRKRASPRQ